MVSIDWGLATCTEDLCNFTISLYMTIDGREAISEVDNQISHYTRSLNIDGQYIYSMHSTGHHLFGATALKCD